MIIALWMDQESQRLESGYCENFSSKLTGTLIYMVMGRGLYISHHLGVHLHYQSPLQSYFQRSSQPCDPCDVVSDSGCSKAKVGEVLSGVLSCSLQLL